MKKYILGIDDGGSLTKAALYALDGTLLAVCGGESVPLKTSAPGRTERDMEALWHANVSAIRHVLAKAKISGDQVAAVSATGHGNGLYLVDANGRPAYDAIISTDARAEGLVDTWVKNPHFNADILPRTAQSLWPGQPPALLAWLMEHEPDAVERSRWALLASGFVRMRLTGQASTNLSDVSGTSLFNVRERRYDPEILDYYGIRPCERLLPPIVDSAQQAGSVTEAAAEETGLVAGTPVAGGIFDISSSALASGLVEKDRLAIVTGTWSINEFVSDAPVVDPDLFMTSIYPTEGAWLITEGSPTSAGVLEWLTNTLLPQAARLAGVDIGGGSRLYAAADRLVFDAATERAYAPAFLPFVFGTSKYPTLRGVLAGLDSSNSLAQVLRSVYEGIVFSHMDHIRRLERFTSLSDEAIFTGGVTNSRPWTQMFSDALQRPLRVVDVKEAGTLGTAMVAATMLGEYSSIREAAQAMAPGYEIVSPDSGKADLYADKFAAWDETLTRMAGDRVAV